MDRRQSMAALAALVLSASHVAAQPKPVPSVGVLTLGAAPSGPLLEAFRQEMRRQGHVEGQTIAYEYRFAQGKTEALPALAAELVKTRPTLLLTESTAATVAAKKASDTLPIVAAVVALDPVKLGLAASLNRPGGNVTGLLFYGGQLELKRLQLFRDTLPERREIAALINAASPNTPERAAQVRQAAQALGLRVHFVEVRNPDDLGAAFAAIRALKPAGMLTISDSMLLNQRERILQFATQAALPAIFPERQFADAGGLMAYGVNVEANFRRAAAYVDRILRGAKPADLPIEEPAKIDFVVNLRTAKALGITVPISVLVGADEVIR